MTPLPPSRRPRPASRSLPSLVTLAAVLFVFVRPAAGANIFVVPGPGTPLQDAIDAAAPGDRVTLLANDPSGATAIYRESIVIDKRIRLRATSNNYRASLILAPCGADSAVKVTSDGVRIEPDFGNLGIGGGITSTVDVVGVRDFRLYRFFVSARDPECDTTALRAINVENSSRVRLEHGWATSGVTEVRIADVLPEGRVLVRNVHADRPETTGFLIENARRAADGRPGVRLQAVHANFGDTGILLLGSAGVRVSGSIIYNSLNAGIHLDAASTDNEVLKNVVVPLPPELASVPAIDVIDDGTGNCWRGNRFTTGTVVQSSCR